ncbi:MAG: riboflavin synthase [Chitinophagales bacterium]|nr:riboflavin synthase [Chitinophagales bacterium]MDW8418687.1 riboflavin synthase [Chitinophagales bacterium]
MFTGIIEAVGTVSDLHREGDNLHITIRSAISSSLRVDQSVAHDGVCLTVIKTDDNRHTVTAVRETLAKTTLGAWKAGHLVNLERCMPADGRFDGHIVQGHVDDTAICHSVTDDNGSWIYRFQYRASPRSLIVEKGSVCINGISLTAFDVTDEAFSVAVIPYTYRHTNICKVRPGDAVNIEYDILGKYIARVMELRK